MRVRLGRSGLHVSPICFGTWQLSQRFWGKQPSDVIIDAVRCAFDCGVNFFDTAGAYGDGHAETVLGEAIAPLQRDQTVIATKVYNHILEGDRRMGDLSREHIISECNDCLKRMKLDYIDLFQCHSFDPLTEPAETIDGFERLIRQGKIRAYGVSNWSVEQLRLGHAFNGRYSTAQPMYHLLERKIETDLLPYCLANDVGTLVYSPLANGLLTGKYQGDETFTDLRQNRPDFQGERFKQVCQRVQSLTPIAQKYGLSIVQLVLTVTLMHPAITCAIVGIKTPDQIKQAIGAMGKTISRDDWCQVRSLIH